MTGAIELSTLDIKESITDKLIDMLKGQPEIVSRYLQTLDYRRGKLIRPRLVLTFADIFSCTNFEHALTAACCCEFLHGATLIHDDVIDQSNSRRGKPTMRAQFGNELAVTVGDFMLTLVIENLLKLEDIKILEMFNQTSQELAIGVINEILNKNNFKMDIAEYIRIIYLKTGALMALCGRVGTALSNTSTLADQELAYGYGKHYGIAFQLVDDLLDVSTDPKFSGKPRFGDLREGRITLPLIDGLDKDFQHVHDLVALVQSTDNEEPAQELYELLLNLGSLQVTKEEAERQLHLARKYLFKINHHILTPEKAKPLQEIEDRLYDLLPNDISIDG